MQEQNNSQESNRIGVGIFIVIVIILLVLAGAAGVYYASLKQEKPKDLSDTTVKSFDLMEESKMVHRTVDDVLLMKRENWQLRDTGRRQHGRSIPLGTGTSANYRCKDYPRRKIQMAWDGSLAAGCGNCGEVRQR